MPLLISSFFITLLFVEYAVAECPPNSRKDDFSVDSGQECITDLLDPECAEHTKNLSHPLPEQCSCDKKDNKIEEVDKCIAEIKRTCTNQCIQDLSACGNKGECEPSCNPDRQTDTFEQVKKACVEQNRERIQGSLIQSCTNQIQQIQRSGPGGAQLICPGGNAQSPNCDYFCQSAVNAQKQNINSCGDKLVTRDGLQSCADSVSHELSLSLPEGASQLPEGFSWQKCDRGLPCEVPVLSAFNTAAEKCRNLKVSTVCCEDAMKCRLPAEERSLLTDLGSLSGGSMTQTLQWKEQTLKEVKSVIEKVSQQCQSAVSSCVKGCDGQRQHIRERLHGICSIDPETEEPYNRNKHTCGEGMITHYVQKYKELSLISGQCRQAGVKQKQETEALKASLQKTINSAEESRAEVSGGVGGSSSGSGGLSGGQFASNERQNIEQPGEGSQPLPAIQNPGIKRDNREDGGGLSWRDPQNKGSSSGGGFFGGGSGSGGLGAPPNNPNTYSNWEDRKKFLESLKREKEQNTPEQGSLEQGAISGEAQFLPGTDSQSREKNTAKCKS